MTSRGSVAFIINKSALVEQYLLDRPLEVLGWIAIRFGLLEILTFPRDRIGIERFAEGPEKALRIRRQRLTGELKVDRRLEELNVIGCELRCIGRRSGSAGSPSYYWVVSLRSIDPIRRPTIEFFVMSQKLSRKDETRAPRRVREFMSSLAHMTGCRMAFV